MPNPKYALDRYNDVAKNGTAGLTKKQQIQAAAQSQYTYTNITDAANVIKWGDNHLTTKAPHSYFDYYFAGQDIKIYIEGAETPEQGELPMMDFAFNMQQQKTPVYGFWSYTFDAVMKGTRIVSGDRKSVV